MSDREETDSARPAAFFDSLRAKLGQSSWWTEAIAGAGAGLFTYFLGHDLSQAMIAAIGAALVLAIIRLKRRVIRTEAQASEAEQNFKLADTAFEETKFALTAVERRFKQRFEDALTEMRNSVEKEELVRLEQISAAASEVKSELVSIEERRKAYVEQSLTELRSRMASEGLLREQIESSLHEVKTDLLSKDEARAGQIKGYLKEIKEGIAPYDYYLLKFEEELQHVKSEMLASEESYKQQITEAMHELKAGLEADAIKRQMEVPLDVILPGLAHRDELEAAVAQINARIDADAVARLDAVSADLRESVQKEQFEAAVAQINARIDADSVARLDAVGADLREPVQKEQFEAAMTQINADALARLDAVNADLQAAKAKLAEDIRRNGAEAVIKTTQKIDELQRETDDVRIGVRDAFRTGRIDASFYRASSFDPEFDVTQVLAKRLKNKRAVDVGANTGEFTKALRLAGFDVDVFEPVPELAASISRHFAGDKKVRVHALACSDHKGTEPLHLAAAKNRAINTTLFSSLTPHASFEGLSFEEKIDVPVARLDDILAPKRRLKIGLLKTDTEGHDLRVLAGASRIDAEALIVEFWDKSYVFNQDGSNNRLEDYLSFVDQATYPYHVVMWRGDERNSFGFIFGARSTPASSWGNILFLKDKSVYDAVHDWAAVSFNSSFVDVDDDEPGLFEPIRGR